MLSCMFSWYASGVVCIKSFPPAFSCRICFLSPRRKDPIFSDLEISFPYITASSPTQHTESVCSCVQDILRRIFLGDYAGKYPRKVFFSEPFPRKTILSKRCDGKSKPTLKMYTTPAEQNHPNPAFVHLPDISRSALFRRCQATAF